MNDYGALINQFCSDDEIKSRTLDNVSKKLKEEMICCF